MALLLFIIFLCSWSLASLWCFIKFCILIYTCVCVWCVCVCMCVLLKALPSVCITYISKWESSGKYSTGWYISHETLFKSCILPCKESGSAWSVLLYIFTLWLSVNKMHFFEIQHIYWTNKWFSLIKMCQWCCHSLTTLAFCNYLTTVA